VRKTLLLLSFVLSSCGGGGGDAVFVMGDRGPRVDFYSADVADMNNDGLTDFVAGGFTIINDDSRNWYISVFLQNNASPGTFSGPVNYTYGPFEVTPTEVEVTDLNGDGLPDVIAAGFSEQGFRVLLNDALNPGVLRQSVHYGPTGEPRRLPGITTADIDGDLMPDVLVADADQLTCYLQNASNPGTFLSGISIGSAFQVPVASDVNNDGLTDVVTFIADNSYEVPESLLYYRHNPTAPGQFLTPIRLDFTFSGGAIGIADLNSDGLKDFVISGFSSDGAGDYRGELTIYLQTPVNVFHRVESHRTSSNFLANRMAIADLDADGVVEIILGQRTAAAEPNTVEIFAQLAFGGYSSNQLLAIPDDAAVTVPELYSVRVADMNNDTLPDIVVSTHEIFVFFALSGQPGTYSDATRITAQRR